MAATSAALPYLFSPDFGAPPQTGMQQCSIDDENIAEFAVRLRNACKRPEELFTPGHEFSKFLSEIYRNLTDSMQNHADFQGVHATAMKTRQLFAPLYERSHDAWLKLLVDDTALKQCVQLFWAVKSVFPALEILEQGAWTSKTRDSHPVSIWVRWMGEFCSRAIDFLYRHSPPDNWQGGLLWGSPNPNFADKLVHCGKNTVSIVKSKLRAKERAVSHPYTRLTNDTDREYYTADQARSDTLMFSMEPVTQSTIVQGHAYLQLIEFSANLAHQLQTLMTLVWSQRAVAYLTLDATPLERTQWLRHFAPLTIEEDTSFKSEEELYAASLAWTGTTNNEPIPHAFGKLWLTWRRHNPETAEVKMSIPTPRQWNQRLREPFEVRQEFTNKEENRKVNDVIFSAYARTLIGGNDSTIIPPARLLVESIITWPDQRHYMSNLIYPCIAHALVSDAYASDAYAQPKVVNANDELGNVLSRQYLEGEPRGGKWHPFLHTGTQQEPPPSPITFGGDGSAFRSNKMPLHTNPLNPDPKTSEQMRNEAAVDAATILCDHDATPRDDTQRLVYQYFVSGGTVTQITDHGLKWYLLWQQTLMCVRAVRWDIERDRTIETKENVHRRIRACESFTEQLLQNLQQHEPVQTLVAQVCLEYNKHLYGYVINRAPQREKADGTWVIDDAFSDWDKFLENALNNALHKPSIRRLSQPQILAAQQSFQLAKEITAGCLAVLQILEIILNTIIEAKNDRGAAAGNRNDLTDKFIPDIGPNTSDEYMKQDFVELFAYLSKVEENHHLYKDWRKFEEVTQAQQFRGLRRCVHSLHDQFLHRRNMPAPSSATQKWLQLGQDVDRRLPSIFTDPDIFSTDFVKRMHITYANQQAFTTTLLDKQNDLSAMHDERVQVLEARKQAIRLQANSDDEIDDEQQESLLSGVFLEEWKRIKARLLIMRKQGKILDSRMREELYGAAKMLYYQPNGWRVTYDSHMEKYKESFREYIALIRADIAGENQLLRQDRSALRRQMQTLEEAAGIYKNDRVLADNLIAKPRWMIDKLTNRVQPTGTYFSNLAFDIVDTVIGQKYIRDVQIAFSGGDYARQLVAAIAYPFLALQNDKRPSLITSLGSINRLQTLLIVSRHVAFFANAVSQFTPFVTGNVPMTSYALLFLADQCLSGGMCFRGPETKSALDTIVESAETNAPVGSSARYTVSRKEFFRNEVRKQFGVTVEEPGILGQPIYDVNTRIFKTILATQSAATYSTIDQILVSPEWLQKLPTALELTGPLTTVWSYVSAFTSFIDIIGKCYLGIHTAYLLKEYARLIYFRATKLKDPDEKKVTPQEHIAHEKRLQQYTFDRIANATSIRSLVWSVYYAEITTLGTCALSYAIRNSASQSRDVLKALFNTVFAKGWWYSTAMTMVAPGFLIGVTGVYELVRLGYNRYRPSNPLPSIAGPILSQIIGRIPKKVALVGLLLPVIRSVVLYGADKLDESVLRLPITRTIVDTIFNGIGQGIVYSLESVLKWVVNMVFGSVATTLDQFSALYPVTGFSVSVLQIAVVVIATAGFFWLSKETDKFIENRPNWSILSLPVSIGGHYIAQIIMSTIVPDVKVVTGM